MGWFHGLFGGRVRGVGAAQAVRLERGGTLLFDVLERSEWHAGHARGARHVPLGQLDGRLEGPPANRRPVVVCRSGSRSRRATAPLLRSGFDAVNLNGGMLARAASGLPVETDGGGPGTVA